jgi:hypothetical protein
MSYDAQPEKEPTLAPLAARAGEPESLGEMAESFAEALMGVEANALCGDANRGARRSRLG